MSFSQFVAMRNVTLCSFLIRQSEHGKHTCYHWHVSIHSFRLDYSHCSFGWIKTEVKTVTLKIQRKRCYCSLNPCSMVSEGLTYISFVIKDDQRKKKALYFIYLTIGPSLKKKKVD